MTTIALVKEVYVLPRKRRGLGKFSFVNTVISVVLIVILSAVSYLRTFAAFHQQPFQLILQVNEPMQLQTLNGKLHVLRPQDPNNGTPRFVTGEELKIFQ